MIVLVLGSAATVVGDVTALPGDTERAYIVGVNRVGIHFPYMDHWASLHPECFHRDRGGPGWLLQRAERGHGTFPVTWGPASKPGTASCTLATAGRGSSGYFGVEVAKHLGADRIVLCGIPMTPTEHFDGDEPWEMANAHWKHWLREHERGKLDGVRSMSGRTRDLLGAPTTEWLRGSAVTTGDAR